MIDNTGRMEALPELLENIKAAYGGPKLSAAKREQEDRARRERENAAAAAAARRTHETLGRQLSLNPAEAVVAVNAVLDKHQPVEDRWSSTLVCSSCTTGGPTGEEPVEWPCETFQALVEATSEN